MIKMKYLLHENVEKTIKTNDGLSVHVIRYDTGTVELRINNKPPYIFLNKKEASQLSSLLTGL